MAKEIRPPAKYPGAKSYLHAWINDIAKAVPAPAFWGEGCCGMASVTLNRAPAPVEVLNDLDGDVVNFFQVLRDQWEELQRHLSLTPYSEKEFKTALQTLPSTKAPLLRAARCFTMWRQSFGGAGKQFSMTVARSRRGMADVVSGWLSAIDENLPLVVNRLRHVQYTNMPVVDWLPKFAQKGGLIYLDPPYVKSSRATPNIYRKEMTDAQHVQMLRVVKKCPGKFMISGYDTPMYRGELKDWTLHVKPIANHAAGGRSKRTMQECLWCNF